MINDCQLEVVLMGLLGDRTTASPSGGEWRDGEENVPLVQPLRHCLCSQVQEGGCEN